MSEENVNKNSESQPKESSGITRRDFLRSVATVPVLGVFGYALYKQQAYESAVREAKLGTAEPPPDQEELNIALLGMGAQGSVLLDAMLKIPNLRFRAVCDIWEDFHLTKAVNMLGKYNFDVNGYVDYREMLDKENDLDAVIIATPDFWHSRHTVDCLEAGLNVYCEKEMSNTIDGARAMVEAAHRTGKLLQIGHQRRSHPRYQHCYNNLLQEARLLGRIVTVNGQWNRSIQPDLVWPDRYTIPEARLNEFGFEDMHQFRNWRWFKGLGGGPIVDLGSHQIDIFSWYLEANPSSVIASGGIDYYPKNSRDWYDTVMVIYEYDTPRGKARAYYQTQTTNGSQGYFENFMGDEGTLLISESEANYSGRVYREASAPPWDEWVRKGYITAPEVNVAEQEVKINLDVRETVSPDEHTVPIEFYDPYHKPHLENFFNSVRGEDTLNCPAEVGYETAVTVLKVNDAVEAGEKLTFQPGEFEV